MKNAAECAKRLNSLLRRLPSASAPEFIAGDKEETLNDPIAALVASFLLWECTTPKALVAWKHLNVKVVDFNDLRVCLPQETAEFIGVRYPRGLERCQRLRATLRDIFRREHAVGLDGLASEGKREARRYLETLDGMVPYVAARVALLCFEAHAVPVDEQTRAHLIAAGAADESVELGELASWLEHHIKAEDAAAAHIALQDWVDRGGGEPKSRSGQRKTSRKKSARKTTKRFLGSRS